jgi:apolipoprotein N-acyltransferase
MKSKFLNTQTLALLTGLLLTALSGLNWNLAIAAFLAPAFILFYAKKINWKGYILLFAGLSLVHGIGKSGENLAGIWILYLLVGLSYGLLNLLPFVIDWVLNKNEKSFFSTLIFPAAFVLVEYLFSLLYGLWGNSSIALYSCFSLIQISAISGIFGVTFLVSWFASVINWMIINELHTPNRKRPALLLMSIIAIPLLFGELRTGIFKPESEMVNVAAIISKTDLHEITENLQEEIIELSENYDLPIPEVIYSDQESLDRQIRNTRIAAQHGAKIIAWNESSLILKSSQIDSLFRAIRQIGIENEVYILLAYIEENESTLPKPFNNKAVLITPSGEKAWEYMKSYPHPIESLITNQGNSTLPYTDTEYGRIGSLICSDMDLTKYVSQAGKKRIDILLVPAFDWEGITPYHPNLSIFQSIQFGFSMLRSNGKGLTTINDFQGEILVQHNSFLSDSEIVYGELPVESTTTIYSRIGNLLAYLSILILLIAIGFRIHFRVSNQNLCNR